MNPVIPIEARNKNRFFEGCGREGPVRGIFLCVFHSTVGPMIACQVPHDSITKDIFECVSVYLIPKSQLVRSIITVTFCNTKIVGYPVMIEDKMYARNAFYFNLCFVCDAWARTNQYDPVVKKLSAYLRALEEEEHFLSKLDADQDKKERLTAMFEQVMTDFNKGGVCTLNGGGGLVCHLKVIGTGGFGHVPDIVKDCDVPLLTEPLNSFTSEQWDLTTNQMLPFIDGFNHVSKIASLADVDINLVKTCLQNLMYYRVIKLIPIFQYCNKYVATPKLRELATDTNLQALCLAAVAPRCEGIREVMRAYCSLREGTSVSDLCLRSNLPSSVDPRMLIQFGLKHSLIRRLDKIGIAIEDSGGNQLQPYLTGQYTYDEICCKLSCPSHYIDSVVDPDPNVTILYK